jgi:integrase
MAVAKWQPQLASSSGEQHGHDDTCDHHHHRADRFRGRRLVRAGTVVVRQAKRPREYLKEPEIERLMETARQNRQGHRDVTAILHAYRHGLRPSELVALRWDDGRPSDGPPACTPLQRRGNRRHPIGRKEITAGL